MARDDDRLRKILTGARVVAVVGASPNPARPSNVVARYLLEQGYEVVPVRPAVKEILGRRCYPGLREVPGPIDVVDVFRRPEACPRVAREAAEAGARVLWLQEGIESDEAAAIAAGAGMEFVSDLCIKKAHQRLGLERPSPREER